MAASDGGAQEEVEALVQRDTPELIALLREVQAAAEQLQDRVRPVMERVKGGEVATHKGVSLVEAKLHLLLLYSAHLVLLVQLKTHGKNIAGHPVVWQLIKIRTHLEKIKPIEHKLKYQIEKLVKVAVTGNLEAEDDALRHRPMVDGFVDLDDTGADHPDGEGVYKPPQLAPVAFDHDESAAAKQAKAQDKRRARLQRSEVVEVLREQLEDAPERIDMGDRAGSAALRRLQDTQRHRQRFEEDNFLRLGETKQDRKERKKLRRVVNPDMEALEDFGQFAEMVAADTASARKAQEEAGDRQRALAAAMSSLRPSNLRGSTRHSALPRLQRQKLEDIRERKGLGKDKGKEKEKDEGRGEGEGRKRGFSRPGHGNKPFAAGKRKRPDKAGHPHKPQHARNKRAKTK